MACGQNGQCTKWQVDKMASGQNVKWTRWQVDKMASGQKGKQIKWVEKLLKSQVDEVAS